MIKDNNSNNNSDDDSLMHNFFAFEGHLWVDFLWTVLLQMFSKSSERNQVRQIW